MEHVAIDLGSRESHVCRRGPEGSVLESKRVRTTRLKEYLATLPASRVIVETCSEAFHIADLANEQGHEVRVVPAALVRALGVGQRGIKTDERDALLLSEASCRMLLPSVHIPSMQSRELKSLSGSRERLIAARTMLINNVRGWLRTRSVTIDVRNPSTFPDTVLKIADGPDGIPLHVERLLTAIEAITEQLREADAELATLAKGELFERLMTVPGVGPVTAVRFVAAIDQVHRFSNAHAVQSYLGLTPGERSSGARVRRTGITKAGPPEVRRAIGQAALGALRSKKHRNDPLIRWALRIKERRGIQIAIVALARKMVGILFAIWRDGSRYHADRGAQKSIG